MRAEASRRLRQPRELQVLAPASPNSSWVAFHSRAPGLESRLSYPSAPPRPSKQASQSAPAATRRARARLADFAGFAAAAALFCALALAHLGVPGLYQDEALDVAPAARLLLHYAVWPYSLLPRSAALPLMVCDHVGPTSTYLMLPFLKLLGVNLLAVRVYEFTIGLLALLLVFLWARRVTPGTAWVAALLLASMPSLWLAARNGLHVSFIVVPIGAGALLCADRWRQEQRPGWLYACAFLLGLGLSTKILFLWFLAACAVGLAATRPALLREVSRRQAAAAALFFSLGCAPFLAFLALSRGLTIRTIFSSAAATPYGVENADFLPNLWTQLHSFARLLDGGWLTWAGGAPRNPLAIAAFLAAAAYGIARGRHGGPRLRFSLIAIAVIVLASCFTISTLGPKHLVILLPFLAVVTAWAVGRAWAERKGAVGRLAFVVLAVLCVAQFAWGMCDNGRYLRTLAATGGVGLFSAAHDELARYLDAHGARGPLAGDWGFDSNLEVLTQGRVQVKQIFDLREAPPYRYTREQTRAALADPGSVFLFHADAVAAAPGRRAAFLDEARNVGVAVTTAAVLRDGRGEPVIYVYQARGSGAP
jgi:hypothetical protein